MRTVNAKTYPWRVGSMKMRRWTSVTGEASGTLARKIQSEIDCLRSANNFLGDRNAGDQFLGGIEASLHRIRVAMQAVPDDRGKDRLHVLGKHLAAALHDRPRLRRAQDRDAGAWRQALRETRRMAGVGDDLLHVIEQRLGYLHLRHGPLQLRQLVGAHRRLRLRG